MAVDSVAGWREVALSDVAEVRLGRQRSPKNHTGEHMRPYLRAANVTWGGLDLADVKEMNFTPAEAEVYALRAGDTVMSEASGSIGEAGKPALWRNEIPGCCLQNTLIRIRPSGDVDPEFLHYRLFLQAASGGWTQGVARGVGIHHLGAQRVAAWRFSIPGLHDQRRIVVDLQRRLSRLAAGEHILVAAERRLELCRAVVGSSAASGRLIGAGSWPAVPIGDVAEVQGGIQKQPKRRPNRHPVPFLRVANVLRGHLDLSEVHEIELFDGELERYGLAAGDLLVVEGNGSASQIGRAAMWSGAVTPCVHQNHLIRVRPDAQTLLPDFLSTVWNAPQTADQLRRVASSTSGLYTLSVAKVRSIEIPLPSLAEQAAVIAEVDRRQSLADNVQAAVRRSTSRAARLRIAVLSRALHAPPGLPIQPADTRLVGAQ